MITRRNYKSLSANDHAAFVAAILKLKKEGNPATGRNYDTYVDWHHQMMDLPMSQMRAHMSPMFLPWHREYVRLLELDLQAVSGNPLMSIPYWDWSAADAGTGENLWAPDFMGGNGRTTDGKVMTGPFAHDAGNWTLKYDDSDRDFLTRNFGRSAQGRSLPTQAELDEANAIDVYDATPWDMSVDGTKSFRNNLEGWSPNPPRLHNLVHVWVGGDDGTMAGASSPNDPVFFLNHANVDRIWAMWQDAKSTHQYLPADEVPERPGVSLHAVMPLFPNSVKVIDVIDYRGLGYQYDTSGTSPAQIAQLKHKMKLPKQVFKPFVGMVRS